ncbi:MAG: 4'-phosphopantetheinyl transferase superfamily protein, partial [Planctomycetaceae bacterium]|nr:4'-phosphopantetheinyl transferase superfamily protein [Planctomycetaceae bacterium]
QVRVLPRENLFRSNPDPQFVLDPVLMDVAMHPLAGWHLEQPDQSGRILLPYELGEIRFYGPRPAVDTEMTSRGRIQHQSSRRFTHSVELVGPHNRIWCTMERLKYWRFYLPFGEFNFHGPKDDYFLSENWSDAIADFPSLDENAACCVGLLPPRDLQAPGMMLASARVTLTIEELRKFRQLKLPDAKKSEWLFGRMAAKDAVRILWRQQTGERMVPADIAIKPDELGKPIASPVGRERPEDYPHVSIAHTEGIVAALGSFDLAPGIDLERIAPREESFEKAAFNSAERDLISTASTDREETLTRFWCAKEAVSKALGQGMVDGPQSLSVTEYDPTNGHVTVEIGPKLAERLPDGASDSPIVARTLRKEDFIIATVLLESEKTCPAATMMSSGKSPGS